MPNYTRYTCHTRYTPPQLHGAFVYFFNDENEDARDCYFLIDGNPTNVIIVTDVIIATDVIIVTDVTDCYFRIDGSPTQAPIYQLNGKPLTISEKA